MTLTVERLSITVTDNRGFMINEAELLLIVYVDNQQFGIICQYQ
jgi:hypothetical protein